MQMIDHHTDLHIVGLAAFSEDCYKQVEPTTNSSRIRKKGS